MAWTVKKWMEDEMGSKGQPVVIIQRHGAPHGANLHTSSISFGWIFLASEFQKNVDHEDTRKVHGRSVEDPHGDQHEFSPERLLDLYVLRVSSSSHHLSYLSGFFWFVDQ